MSALLRFVACIHWDADAASDTVFGFSNWMLREFDAWIDSLPAPQRTTSTGKNKK